MNPRIQWSKKDEENYQRKSGRAFRLLFSYAFRDGRRGKKIPEGKKEDKRVDCRCFSQGREKKGGGGARGEGRNRQLLSLPYLRTERGRGGEGEDPRKRKEGLSIVFEVLFSFLKLASWNPKEKNLGKG